MTCYFDGLNIGATLTAGDYCTGACIGVEGPVIGGSVEAVGATGAGGFMRPLNAGAGLRGPGFTGNLTAGFTGNLTAGGGGVAGATGAAIWPGDTGATGGLGIKILPSASTP